MLFQYLLHLVQARLETRGTAGSPCTQRYAIMYSNVLLIQKMEYAKSLSRFACRLLQAYLRISCLNIGKDAVWQKPRHSQAMKNLSKQQKNPPQLLKCQQMVSHMSQCLISGTTIPVWSAQNDLMPLQAYEGICSAAEAGRAVPSFFWKAAEGRLLGNPQQPQSLPEITQERLLRAYMYEMVLLC